MPNPPPLSRRDFLRAGSVGLGASFAGCTGGSSVSFETWTPEKGTWPLARYDPGNSGYNPNATPPREGVEQVWQTETEVDVRGLVVAHNLLAAYGSSGMVVVSTPSSTDQKPERRQREFLPTPVAGFGPRSERGGLPLFAAGGIGHRDGTMMGLARRWVHQPGQDSGQWQSFWQAYEIGGNGGEPRGLVTSDDTLYVGHTGNEALIAFDTDDGSIRWRKKGSGYPALADDRIVARG